MLDIDVERDCATSVLHMFVVLGAIGHKFWLPRRRPSSDGQVAFPCRPLMPHRQRQFLHTMLLYEFFQGLVLPANSAERKEQQHWGQAVFRNISLEE